jgi:tRNA-binding EMAP/Myf-like protein
MESATTISFSTTQPAKLTLVFNTDFTGKVTIDGKSYTPTAGILSEGMLLCAENDKGELALVTPDKDMPAGAEIC